jgi:hypothetical protein
MGSCDAKVLSRSEVDNKRMCHSVLFEQEPISKSNFAVCKLDCLEAGEI